MKFTRKSYGRLLRADGTQVSQHTVAEEAYERAAVSGAGTYTYIPPMHAHVNWMVAPRV